MSRGVGNSKPRSLPGIDGQQAIVKLYKGNGREIVKTGKKLGKSPLFAKFAQIFYCRSFLLYSTQ